LRADGTIAFWGRSTLESNVLSSLSNAVALASGDNFCLALLADGTVATAGGAPSLTPPAGLANVVAIAAGASHALALRADGTVVAWGENFAGQATVPAGLSNVVAIAAGGYSSLALTNETFSDLPWRLQNPALSSGLFTMSAVTKRGKTYYLQRKRSLQDGQWWLFAPVAGDDTVRSFSDTPSNAQAFYRLWEKP
jgi:hypothetical protein